MFEVQRFGRFSYAGGGGPAMLCRDQDSPFEAMLHWYKSTNKYPNPNQPAALHAAIVPNGADWDVYPVRVHCVIEDGTVIPANPQHHQAAQFLASRGKLVIRGTAVEIRLLHPSGREFNFSFPEEVANLRVLSSPCPTWQNFKSTLREFSTANSIALWRGQGPGDYPLKTTLHRAGRSRIETYCEGPLEEFRAGIETLSDKHLNPRDRNDTSRLLALAQHYGLPTPALDWTKSPYIAAYFAFADALESQKHRDPTATVRVFALTQNFVNSATPSNPTLAYYRPYIFMFATSAGGNPRLHAQQGQFMVTNICNLEHHIRLDEISRGAQVLFAYDIPASESVEAIEDLRFMGISPASMFSGFDGLAKSIRHQMLIRDRLDAA